MSGTLVPSATKCAPFSYQCSTASTTRCRSGLPTWWGKAYLFSADAGLGGCRVLYLDLDTVRPAERSAARLDGQHKQESHVRRLSDHQRGLRLLIHVSALETLKACSKGVIKRAPKQRL